MKPEHQGETRRHRAIRIAGEAPVGLGARAEAFELRFFDGTRGRAELGLALQRVDAHALGDPELPGAIMAWLAARGGQRLRLRDFAGATVREHDFDVTVFDSDVTALHRIVSLAPSNAELVEALGAVDRLIACEDSSDLPSGSGPVERLGPDLGPDLDRIAELNPDLVVSSL